MGLEVTIYVDADTGNEVPERIYLYEATVTHNLTEMAKKAGIYQALWRPKEINAVQAGDIVEILKNGLDDLKLRKDYFEQFNFHTGNGVYEDLVPFVEKYYNACIKNPKAFIQSDR